MIDRRALSQKSRWLTWSGSVWDLVLVCCLPPDGRASRGLRWAGLLLTVCAVVVYDSLFYNRYYPLSEGWFSTYARFMANGFLPYRDFHLFLTPLYQMLICLFTSHFGYSMALMHRLGLVISGLMAGFLYAIGIEFFSVPTAVVAAIFSLIYYQSSIVFIGYDFLQFMNLFTLIASWLLCRHFRPAAGPALFVDTKIPWRILLAGFFASMAFLTKQSNGFMIEVFLGLAVFLAGSVHDRRIGSRLLYWFLSGATIPLVLTWAWLVAYNLWGSFISDTLTGGAASKGGIHAILLGWIPRFFSGNPLKGVLLALAILAVIVIESKWHSKRAPTSKPVPSALRSWALLWFIGVCALVCILLPYEWMDFSLRIQHVQLFDECVSSLTFLGTFFAVTIAMGSVYANYSHRREGALPLLIIGVTSVGILFGNGTSAAIDMAGAFIPVAMMIGFAFSALTSARGVKTVFVFLCAMMTLFLCSQKYVMPYQWWGLTQSDVRRVAPIQGVPELAGLQASMAGGDVYNEVTALIKKYSSPGDTLFTFPHMAQFNLLTGRNPNTFAAVEWFDVAPDDVARHDAQVLQVSPPKIFVFLDIPETVWEQHELGFRGGKPSAQREIREVLCRLIDQGRYALVFKRYIPAKNLLTVWVRRDAIAEPDKDQDPHA